MVKRNFVVTERRGRGRGGFGRGSGGRELHVDMPGGRFRGGLARGNGFKSGRPFRGGGRQEGGRGRGRGRRPGAGRGNKKNGKQEEPLDEEKLDLEMDKYWTKSGVSGSKTLDDDLKNYWDKPETQEEKKEEEAEETPAA